MKIILQDRYKLLKEGKINEYLFIKEAKQLYPTEIRNAANLEETVNYLKKKRVIFDETNSLVTENKTPKFEQDFKKFLSEAKIETPSDVKVDMKKTSKEVEDLKYKGVDTRDKSNPNNIPNQQFITGMYAEYNDEKNKDKTYDQLVALVVKNIASDQLYYVKNGQFGIKGLGYKTEGEKSKLSKTDKMEKVEFDNNSTALKSNTKDVADKAIKSKVKDEMTNTPKSLRGVQKMDLPGKEKKIKLDENKKKLKLDENHPLSEIMDEATTPKYFETLEEAKKWASEFSKKERVTVHVNETRGGGYVVEDWYDYEKTVASYEGGDQFNESMNSDFDGSGLVVVGSTQIDNNAIKDMLEGSDYYGIWNSREGYFFFPEEESLLDELESNLQNEFSKLGINARFESQINESISFLSLFEENNSSIKDNWDTMDEEEKMNILLQFVKDPDDAEELLYKNFQDLPNEVIAGIQNSIPSDAFGEEPNPGPNYPEPEDMPSWMNEVVEDEYYAPDHSDRIKPKDPLEGIKDVKKYITNISDLVQNKSFMRELEADDLTEEEAIDFLQTAYNEDDIQQMHDEVYGSYENEELEEQKNHVDIWDEGYQAAKKLKTLEDNPYSKTNDYQNHMWWKKGWASYLTGYVKDKPNIEKSKQEINENMDPLKTFRKFLLTEAKKDFQKGDKVTYLGHPAVITGVNKEMTGATTYNVLYNKGNGKTKATNIFNKDNEIKPLTEAKQLATDNQRKKARAALSVHLSAAKEDNDEENIKELIKARENIMKSKYTEQLISILDDYGYDEEEIDKIVGKGKLEEAKKIPVSKKITEIEKNAANIALESKINAIDEEITRRNNQIKMVEENEDLSELVDKNRMKELQKEIKLLEKQKDKYVKLYEKQTGKKKQEVVTDSKADAAEEAPIEEATEEDITAQKELNAELENTKKAATELTTISQEAGLAEEIQPTEDELTKMKDELESYIDMVDNFEEAVKMYIHFHPEAKKYEITLRQLAEPMF